MKMNITKIIIAIMLILSLMFAEYRIIMNNISVHLMGNCAAVEVFGQVDHYDWDEWK